MKTSTRKLVLSAMLIAFGAAAGGIFYIPVGVSKVYPVQHFLNVVGAVILGPYYAVINAFVISLLRNMTGTGTLLAFPGSMVGALLAGLLFKKSKNVNIAALGELFGTGILGAVISYPVAVYLMGKKAALLAFVAPFSISSFGGMLIAVVFLQLPVMKKLINKLRGEANV